jgi:hypothetical protein
MTQPRQRLADFEARSVQLIAACTLGLAGMASVPPAHATRATGLSTSLTGAPGNTTSAVHSGTNRSTAVLLQAGKPLG